MSEIDIEKKESGGVPWWAWLLGLLALAAIIWYATAAMSAKPLATATTDNSALVADANNSAMATNEAANNNTVDSNIAPAMNADANAASAMNANATDANTADANAADANATDMSMSNSAPGNSTVPAATSGEVITNILSVVAPKEPATLYGKSVKLLGAPVQAAGTKLFWIGPSFEQKMLVVTDANTNMNGINTGVVQRDRVDIEGTLMKITDFKDAKAKYNLDDNAITFLTNKKMLLMATSVKRDKN